MWVARVLEHSDEYTRRRICHAIGCGFHIELRKPEIQERRGRGYFHCLAGRFVSAGALVCESK